ncbi:MAG: amidohydrolase family protein [Verrucomicrobiota bacterium]|nr:amidohydrolase family protein [Verrucomicrobiota bacterium]MCC6819813.1 amidohydrolase family protein [Limisphaerales bacterium]
MKISRKQKATITVISLLSALALAPALAQDVTQKLAPAQTLITNVRIFDGQSDRFSAPSHVLVRGNKIERIAAQPIPTDQRGDTVLIDGGGRTLMPGLIDAHTHIMFETVPQMTLLTADIGYINVAAVKAANEMMLRGFTSIRDLGGPVFGLKRGIDTGVVSGPRIWPSGVFISQTGGHGDFRLPTDFPAKPGDHPYAERIGIAEVLKMATADNAELLALSGLRSPYAGKLGVVAEDALADLLPVDGDPIANLRLIADPAKDFLWIMKDGKIYRNTI